MKELEKQYNKDVKKPANFSFHRPSYMAGGRGALEWIQTKIEISNKTESYVEDILIAVENWIKEELREE